MINIKNFNNIRIVALASILLIHTGLYNVGMNKFSADAGKLSLYGNQLLLSCLYTNLFKSGTILFFIMSGFLFEKQFEKFNNFSVLIKKKAKSLLRPYLILFVIPTFILTWATEPNFGFKENYDLYLIFLKTVEAVFFTNYWFVPALFVTLIINYFIKTKDVTKSLTLFSFIWLIFYINLYCHFVTTYHTVWFIGFFFIFTLGRLMYIYNDKITNFRFLNKNNLIFTTILFYIISNIESILVLKYSHNADFLNTLRIGNIMYSFSIFFLFNILFNRVKFTLPIDVSFYFIYLIHPFILRLTNLWMIKNNLTVFEYPTQYIYNIIHFLTVITTCVAIQQIFFKLRFKSKYLSEYVFKK